jgi:hypothetical protein
VPEQIQIDHDPGLEQDIQKAATEMW